MSNQFHEQVIWMMKRYGIKLTRPDNLMTNIRSQALNIQHDTSFLKNYTYLKATATVQ